MQEEIKQRKANAAYLRMKIAASLIAKENRPLDGGIRGCERPLAFDQWRALMAMFDNTSLRKHTWLSEENIRELYEIASGKRDILKA